MGSQERFNKFRLSLILVVAAAVIGVIQFLICTGLSMSRYKDYSFANNSLSDLGCMANEHHAIFNGSLIFLGLAVTPVFIMMWITDPRRSFSIRATAVFGIISTIGLIGVGLSPVDRHFVWHFISLALWLFPMFYMTVSFFTAASRSPYVGIGFLSAALLMVVIMIAVMLRTELSTLELLQKAVVVCGLVWLTFIIAFIIQSGVYVLKNWDHDDLEKEKLEQEYFTELKTGRVRD